MKILMTAGSPRRREGGTSAVIYSLGRALQARGHEVDFLFREDLVADEEMKGRFRELKFAWRLARHIRRSPRKYDVVNFHAPVGCVYGLLHRYLPKSGDPPYVVCLHALEERRAHAMKREARKGRAWHFNWKNRAWHRVYHQARFDLSVSTADAAHCFCRDVWTLLQLKYGLDPEKVLFVLNAAEERYFQEHDYSDRRPLRLLYAGTWLDQRGIFYLRDALTHLLGTFTDWTMTFAGVATREETVRNFFGAPLQKHISVLPIVANEEMPKLYADHDIFLLPSLMEGLPFVVLEAMASGLPVVTTETCGMVDVIEDRVDGLLLPPADAAAIERAIVLLAESPDLRAKLGKAAQDRMRKHTWQSSAEKIEALFQSVLKTSSRAGSGK